MASTYKRCSWFLYEKKMYPCDVRANALKIVFIRQRIQIINDACSSFSLSPSCAHSTLSLSDWCSANTHVYSGCVFVTAFHRLHHISSVKSFITNDESTTTATGFTPDWFTFTANEIMDVCMCECVCLCYAYRIQYSVRLEAMPIVREHVFNFCFSASLSFSQLSAPRSISHACRTLIVFQAFSAIQWVEQIIQLYRWNTQNSTGAGNRGSISKYTSIPFEPQSFFVENFRILFTTVGGLTWMGRSFLMRAHLRAASQLAWTT